jgi:hypothetical protein
MKTFFSFIWILFVTHCGPDDPPYRTITNPPSTRSPDETLDPHQEISGCRAHEWTASEEIPFTYYDGLTNRYITTQKRFPLLFDSTVISAIYLGNSKKPLFLCKKENNHSYDRDSVENTLLVMLFGIETARNWDLTHKAASESPLPKIDLWLFPQVRAQEAFPRDPGQNPMELVVDNASMNMVTLADSAKTLQGGTLVVYPNGRKRDGDYQPFVTEQASVFAHEYGHYILHGRLSVLFSSSDSLPLNEGLADLIAYLSFEEIDLPGAGIYINGLEGYSTRIVPETHFFSLDSVYVEKTYPALLLKPNRPYHSKGGFLSNILYRFKRAQGMSGRQFLRDLKNIENRYRSRSMRTEQEFLIFFRDSLRGIYPQISGDPLFY